MFWAAATASLRLPHALAHTEDHGEASLGDEGDACLKQELMTAFVLKRCSEKG